MLQMVNEISDMITSEQISGNLAVYVGLRGDAHPRSLLKHLNNTVVLIHLTTIVRVEIRASLG